LIIIYRFYNNRGKYNYNTSYGGSFMRCEWAGEDPLYIEYHDKEWGVPIHDDRKLFELLILEGAQAGLSWITILRKRENYRQAFDNFVPEIIAKYDANKILELMNNPGIVRNRRKIEAAVRNAKAFLELIKEFETFDAYIWGFVDGESIKNSWNSLKEVPAKTHVSDVMSKDLKKRGFNFVGSTICYAFMQAAGLVNDHITTCFRYNEIVDDGHCLN
jgi:DNA-3-methyladenine glycosylase I